MINYNVLENENTLDDEENKAADIPTENDVVVKTGTEADETESDGNVIQPNETETEENEVEDTPSNRVDVKEAIDFLGNNKLGYNIWDTIVKGV